MYAYSAGGGYPPSLVSPYVSYPPVPTPVYSTPVTTPNEKPAPQTFTKGPLGWISRISHAIHHYIYKAFFALGAFTAARPYTVILLSLALCALTAVGLIRFKPEQNPETLFTPQSSQAITDQAYVEGTWGREEPRPVDVYWTAKSGTQVITKDILNTVFDIHDIVVATTYVREGETLTYDNRCYKPDGVNCMVTSILDYWNYSRSAMQADPDIFATINAGATTAVGSAIAVPTVMGGVKYVNGLITEAAAYQYILETWQLKGSANSRDKARKWTEQVTTNIREYTSSVANVYPWTQSAQQSESNADIRGDLVKFFSGFALLFVYAFVSLTSSSWIHSRTLMALASLVGICMAIISTFGISSLIGQQWNQVVNILPFLLLGLGMDDTFVICDILRKTKAPVGVTDVQAIVANRIPRTIARAGASILVTSLTDMVAFFVGSFTILEGLKTFCIFAGFGILFDFIYQVTFVLGWLVLDVRRSTKGRVDCCCCGPTKEEPAPLLGCGCCKPTVPFDENNGRLVQEIFRRGITRYALSIPGKVIILGVASILLGFGVWGTTKLKQEFSSRWFVPSDSWIQDTFAVQDQYFSGGSPYAAVYTKTGDYSTSTSQTTMWNLGSAIANDPFAQAATINSWSNCFVAWAICNKGVSGTCPSGSSCSVTASSQIATADYYTYLNEFLLTDSGAQYQDHIIWTDTTNTSISATRIPFAMVGSVTTDSNIAVNAMNSLRSAVAPYSSSSLESMVYSYVFLFWEGFAVIQEETVRNIIIAACTVFIVLVILLANLLAALLVLGMIALIDADLLGFMYWIGLSYNSVTTICLLVAIGISVDYSVHIAHAYLVSHGTKQSRATQALNDLGGSVLNGGITTFLAIVPLAFSTSYVFQVFFKMFALIIGLGLFHGLLVLPVLLSLIGPWSTPHPVDVYGDKEAEGIEDLVNAPVYYLPGPQPVGMYPAGYPGYPGGVMPMVYPSGYPVGVYQ